MLGEVGVTRGCEWRVDNRHLLVIKVKVSYTFSKLIKKILIRYGYGRLEVKLLRAVVHVHSGKSTCFMVKVRHLNVPRASRGA